MLLLEHIHHAFDADTVLEDLSLHVEKGSVACLVGSSGSGKSTLLRLIAGLETLQKGRITIDGNDVAAGSGLHVRPEKRGVGLVFQHPSLFPHLNILENVMFGLPQNNKKQSEQIARDLLEQTHYYGDVEAYPHMLSGGQHQRVALARALAPAPSVLLLDEPFANLDSLLRQTIRDEVFALLKRRGTTTIMVTHDPKEALTLADKIFLLHKNGQIHQEGTPEEIYCTPEDAEVAKFFGEANILSANDTKTLFNQDIPQDKHSLLRPEMLCVAKGCKVKTKSIEARIISSKFYGSHYMLDVICGNIPLKVAEFRGNIGHAKIGETIHLELRNDKILHIL